MEGGVKYHPSVLKQMVKKVKQTYKNKKKGIPLVHGNIPKLGVIKTVKKRTLNLKKAVEELIQVDREPNEFLPMAVVLIKKLLKVSKKDKGKADGFVISLVNSLYYSLRKENNINNDNNNTESENMNENNIWNDPYRMLRTLVRKLEELMETDNEEFKLEISETIKEGFKYGYDKIYLKKTNVNVDELTELFSGAKV
jgi:hypothetical protein